MRASAYITLAAAASGIQGAAVARGSGSDNPPIRNVFTFGPNTFIENIAVRANSNLLITSMSVPDLFSIDPTVASPSASIVHTFPNGTGLSGIAEVTPDVFALVTGIWDLANTRAALGSLAVWTIDLNRTPPEVKLITHVANSTILNGVARHPTNPRLLLCADSALGAIWRVDLITGAYSVVFSSPLFQRTATAHLGINGLRSAPGSPYLYFTNSAQGLFGRVAVQPDGNQAGAVEVISNNTGAGADVVYDDIALDLNGSGKKGDAWIASHPSYAVRVGVPGGGQHVVEDTAKLLNPTSAAFGRGGGREKKTLYVTNGGEFLPDFTLVNEGVVAIDLR